MTKETTIPLHPERGLDPHLTFCPRCGGETNSLTLGVIRAAELSNGQLVYVTKGKERGIVRELRKRKMLGDGERLEWRDLEEHERVPDNSVCDKCKEQINKWADLVKAGGVYFKCQSCGCNGVIQADSELAKAVRKSTKVEPPAPVGVAFEKCSAHTELIEDDTQTREKEKSNGEE